jgi:hypothetical protein
VLRVTVFLLCFVTAFSASAQLKVPEAIYINFDTARGFNQYSDDRNDMQFSIALKLENQGMKVIELENDTAYYFNNFGKKILQPSDTTRIYIKYNWTNKNMPWIWNRKRGENEAINVSYRYGGRLRNKKIKIIYSYGLPLTALVDTGRWVYNPSGPLYIKVDVTIKNVSTSALIAPTSGIAYNDWGSRLDFNLVPEERWFQGQVIKPGATGEVCVSLNMDQKRHVHVKGNLIIFSSDYTRIDIIPISFQRDFDGRR